ncbi:hypothetical protein [Nonomuraea sp. NPDC050202]|uniref:hypothetical protein n=1 Tax=Nonomuraea sp. NPDC050202 TaxID=3155035 RepID=UPI003406450E
MRSKDSTTDGWRGLPGPRWSEREILSVVLRLAASGALASTTLIGFDTRAGSRELARLAATLLRQRGLRVGLAQEYTPTPAVGRFAHRHDWVAASLTFTASHNPPGTIGLKFRSGDGYTPPSQDLPDADVNVLDLLESLGTSSQPPPDPLDPTADYAATVGTALSRTLADFDGQVVLDCAYGAVGPVAARIGGLRVARKLPLPFFSGITPDPMLQTDMEQISTVLLGRSRSPERTVVAMTDGDGDRLALFTRRSGYINSSELAAVLLTSAGSPHVLITTSVAPSLAATAAEAAGVGVVYAAVGFKNVVAAWKESGRPSAIGLEPNGGIARAGSATDYFERDALAALTLALRATGSVDGLDRAVALVRALVPFRQRQHNVAADPEVVAAAVRTVLPGWTERRALDATVFTDAGVGGRVALRQSGTEPLTRLYMELPAHLTDSLRALLPAAG